MKKQRKQKCLPEAPEGYLFAATSAGIKYKDREDLALIYSVRDANVAGVFTNNRIKSAPVLLDIRRTRRYGTCRAIIVNSGNANACTGTQGMADAKRISRELALRLDIHEREVLPSSTGVIGTPLPMDRFLRGVKELPLKLDNKGALDVARAIMTTDTFPKITSRSVHLGKRRGVILGIAKGAGMIAPDLATMLCFILTDLNLESRTMKDILTDVVDVTFNSITIDGDMSTNDTVLLLSNGASGNTIDGQSRYLRTFRDALFDVCHELSTMIVRDGEGATKSVTVYVRDAKNKRDAKLAAGTVAGSLLVKTALYGGEVNWGRIMASLGRSGVPVKENLTDIVFNGIRIVKEGMSTGMEKKASLTMKNKDITIEISLGMGGSSWRYYTCDLTDEYIRINAEYLS